MTDANHGTNWEIDRLKNQLKMVSSIKFNSGLEISADWLNKFASAFTSKKSSHAPSELSSNQQKLKESIYKNEPNQSNLYLYWSNIENVSNELRTNSKRQSVINKLKSFKSK